MAPAADLDAFYTQLRRRMIETGEWDRSVVVALLLICWLLSTVLSRIMFALSSKLNEDGWIDELKDHSKESARDTEQFAFQPFLDGALTYAQSKFLSVQLYLDFHSRMPIESLPSQTEKEIKSVIRQYLEQQFE